MALQIWLPLNGDLHNQGLSNVTTINNGAIINNNGKIGKCYSFNGSSYIDTGYVESFGTEDFTICCWIYLTQVSGKTYQCIIGNKGTGAASAGISLYYNQNQKKFLWSTADGSNATEIWSVDTFDTVIFNKWHHIAMVRNHNDTKKGYFYFDGIRKEIASIPAIRNVTSTISLKIGSVTPTYAAYYYTGQINDVRIYSHALSDKEIKKISQGLILHYPLNYGNENLLSNYVTPGQNAPGSITTAGRTNYYGNYGIIIPATENADTYFRLFLKQQLIQGKTYTISCYVSGLLSGTYYNFPLFAQGNTSMGILQLNHNGLCSLTFTMNSSSQSTATTPEGTTVYICFMDDSARTLVSGQGPITLTGFKLEQGNYVTNQYFNNIIYDSSGYNNNGQLNQITINSNCPRYNINSVFNGTNSYIKVIENKWMPQHTRELTINLWAKAATWPTGGRIFSCTESGGFNTEGGNSGYWRFPIYVCTNEAQTSYAYKYDSQEIQLSALPVNEWVMLTFVYDSTGTRTYINGQLHHTYTNTSYGIHFNTNARLFLGCEANTASPSSPYFNGEESDFRIYITALSAEDILDLYKTSKIINGTNKIPRDLE